MKELPDTKQNTRLKAVLTLLATQGLREIEVRRLDVKDIDQVNLTAMVQGKGQDDREAIHLHPGTAEAIRKYLDTNNIKDGPLFTSQSNNSRDQRLSTRSIRSIVKKVLSESGINRNVHGFRHYFVTRLIRQYKADLIQVKGYTRHKCLEMLVTYNDEILMKEDLPRFHQVFSEISF